MEICQLVVYKACHGNRCGYGAMVLIMVEQIFITGSDPDAQEQLLQKTVHVIQLPIPGREDTFAA
jgi:glycerol dehydrogenase-like iron-containing ADH family enzyme